MLSKHATSYGAAKCIEKLEFDKQTAEILECTCTIADRNIYLFHYYDEILKSIGETLNIDFSARAMTSKEI